MKKLIGVWVMCTALLCGCSAGSQNDFNYKYSGENDEWLVTYEVDAKGRSTKKTDESNNVLKLEYKGSEDEQQLINNVEVKLNSSATNMQFVQTDFSSCIDKYLKSTTSTNGSSIESEDETIKVTIKVDNNYEIIELHNSNK